MTRLMTTTALALALTGGAVFAESHTNGEQIQQNLENAGESLENAGENAANATAEAIDDAAQTTENAAESVANSTEQALDNAGQTTANIAEEADDAATQTVQTLDNTATDVTDMADNTTNLIRVRDILGGEIYSVNSQEGDAEFATTSYMEMDDSWENIGEIEDIVLDSDGKLRGIVAEVGGFLNIGDKHVFLPMENVKLVPVEDASYKLVVGYSEEQLEQMQSVDEALWN